MAGHLILEEREIIAHEHRAGKMQTQIADRLGRSKSTISRELRRRSHCVAASIAGGPTARRAGSGG
jgi:IS30 family transposase